MTNPTSNYGFVLPTSTDLVTDLPADFEVALQGVDTRLKALQPGTTLGDIAYSSATANTNTRLPIGTSGQVLAVSGGGVPAWTTTADVTPLTTKGDLFTFTTADARLGVGTDGQTLVADSTASTGLKWATPVAGMTNPLTTTGDTIYSSSGTTPARLGIGTTGQVLTVAGGIPSWATPASGGKVLQVVQNTYATATNIASTTFTDTGLSATITPSSASSKVLVFFAQSVRPSRATEFAAGALRLLRGGTSIYALGATFETAGVFAASATEVNTFQTVSSSYLDSPSTTSATTYKTQARANSTANSGTILVNPTDTTAVMILMEIGA